MVDVMSFSEDARSVPDVIKIIPTGKFKTPKYGELEITREMLEQMREHFQTNVRAHSSVTGLPIDVEHGETAHRDAAAGWMKDILVSDDGAYAKVEWTPLGQELLEKGLYKFFSPEFTFDYVNNEQSIYFANVVTGGGLVNKPLFDHSLEPIVFSEDGNVKNLTAKNSPHILVISKDEQVTSNLHSANQSESLTASEKEKSMDLQTILAKEKSARTSEEQLFVAANLDQLSDEQKVVEGFVVAPVTASEEKVEEKAEETVEEVKAEAPAEETKVEAPAETVVASEKISAAETRIKQLEAELVKMNEETQSLKAKEAAAAKEIEKNKVTEHVKAFTFSENGGRIAPAQVEPIVNLMLTMSESQRAELSEILGSLPEKHIFGEKGSDENLGQNQKKDLLQARITDRMKEKSMTYKEASAQIIAEEPELYRDSLQAVR
jgi:hypothetical protein